MKRFFLAGLLFLSLSMLAQRKPIPGYMGRRFSVSHGYFLCPGYRPFLENGRVVSRIRAVNVQQILDVNYIIAYRRAISAAVYVTRRDLVVYTLDRNIDEYVKRKDKMTAYNFSLGYKLFRKNRFAPLGPYMKWEATYAICYLDYGGETEVTQGYYPYYTSETITYEPHRINMKFIGGGWSVGRQYVVKDRILLDAGVRLALNIGTRSNSVSYREREAAANAEDIFFMQSFVNVRIAAGFLAF